MALITEGPLGAAMETLKDHDVSFQEIEGLFLGRLSGRRSEQVRAHVRGCSACEQAYERLASLDRALYGAGEAVTPPSLRGVRARLFEELAPPRRAPRWRLGLVGGAVAAAACVMLVGVGTTRLDGFRARGAGEQLVAQVSLRALLVRRGPDAQLEVGDATQVALRPGDQLKLLYSSSGTHRFVSVYVAGDGVEAVLTDAPIGDAVDEKLPGTLTVSEAWSGATRLIAVFHDGDGAPPAADAAPGDSPGGALRVLPLRIEATP